MGAGGDGRAEKDGEPIEVIVEVPRGTRNKYEYDHVRDVIFLDRRLFSATFYPVDYGFIPGTLAEDGDPLDALVIVEDPTFPGCHIRVRPIGLLRMSDEHGKDAKVLSVPASDPIYTDVHTLEDLPAHLADEITHFFEVYKDLEPGKGTRVEGFYGPLEAWDEIRRAEARAARS